MDWFWRLMWERSRRWAAHQLTSEIQRAYNDNNVPYARRLSLTLDAYCQIERRVRDYVADDDALDGAVTVYHYPPPSAH